MPANVRAPKRSRRPRWLRIVSICLVLLVAAAVFCLIHFWPFSQQKVFDSLQDRFPGVVKASKFHGAVFPYAGCVAENLELLPSSELHGARIVITVKKFTVQASYADLFLRPGHLNRVILEGLRVQVVPANAAAYLGPLPPRPPFHNTKNSKIDELLANGSLLEVGRESGGSPLRFEFRHLVLETVRDDRPLSYDVVMENPQPTGEIRVKGKFGPWNGANLGQTPASGSYAFDHANLGDFHGIAGILSSQGKFEGPLSHIAISGKTDIPDFEVRHSKHADRLQTTFDAAVNGLNGDTFLNRVDASFLRTAITFTGSIAGQPDREGKIANLDFTSHDARVENLLRMFVKEASPPMTAAISFHGHVALPGGSEPFLQKLVLEGDFKIAGARLTNPQRQSGVDDLSKNARGKKKEKTTESVTADAESHVVLRRGIAKLTNLSYVVPGATAKMNGTFSLIDKKVDFHGPLKTESEVSKQASGIKAVLLKPIDPLFKRKHAGAVVPVEMTGTYSQPHFGLDLPAKK
jgi:hypothetical protein